MKKFTESFGNIAPPAVVKFSDSIFYYSLNAGGTANVPVPVDASYVEITASQFVTVSPTTVSGAPSSSPSGTAGIQTVQFNPAIISGTSTGLPNTSQVFTATLQIDGVNKYWSDVGSNLQSFGTLLTSLNTFLSTSATASIANGQLVVTSGSTGVNSKVRLTSVPVMSATPTPTLTATTSPTHTATPSVTPSITVTITGSPLATRTPTLTPSITDSPGITVTPTVTPTLSHTPSATPTHTGTPAVTPTISATASLTPTVTVTKSITPTISVTPSSTASGLFYAITSFVDFNAPVDGVLTSSNSEVVLTTVKQIDPLTTTVIGVYAPTSGTIVSVAFYR